jgi:hypothetical protein
MQLIDYPDAIAAAELAHLKAQGEVRALTEALEARKAEFGLMVANDESLSNDAKRKAARAELELSDPDYLKLQRKLLAAKEVAAVALIEAGRVANLFKAERLLGEMAVAGVA